MDLRPKRSGGELALDRGFLLWLGDHLDGDLEAGVDAGVAARGEARSGLEFEQVGAPNSSAPPGTWTTTPPSFSP